MVKGDYHRMIWNLQLSRDNQDKRYIHAFLMDPDFVLMENIMPRTIGKLSQILKLSKGDSDTPNLTEEMAGPFKSDFSGHESGDQGTGTTWYLDHSLQEVS